VLPLPPPPPSKPTPAVRPAFVWALVLVAFPILVLFSVGMVAEDEIEASKRLVMAPIYLLGAWVARSCCGGVSFAEAPLRATPWRPRSHWLWSSSPSI
jgi:hypothetical protein